MVRARVGRLLFLCLLVAGADAVQAQTIAADAILSTVRTLASPEFEGRQAGTTGGLKARAWIAERFKAIGLEPLPGGDNVVGLCKGTATGGPMLVVTAHYDHLGIRNGVMYPGADDNASGVAVMLAIAERCPRAPFKHDALFVAFDAEEGGMQGAKAFIANPPVPKERLALNINLDMVSRSDRRELYAAGTHHWPATRPLLEQVAKRAPVTLLFGHDTPKPSSGGADDWTNQSDHAVFHRAGIPFVYFGVEDHVDYHKPTDTADKIDPGFFRDAANTILDAVITLDASFPFGH